MRTLCAGALALAIATASASGAYADERARPGALEAEPATPHALALRWIVHGDADADAAVRLRYRRVGEDAWRDGLALWRIHPGRASARNRIDDGWVFAASIVDLVPATDYEVRLDLADPDGGADARTVRLRTGAEPAVDQHRLRARHVVPGDGGGSGDAGDPYRGLEAALAAAVPGDLVLLAPGTYAGAAYRPARSGDPAAPIVVRGRAPGTVRLDGGGAPVLFDLGARAHVWIEDLALAGTDILILADDAAGLALRRNRFEVSTIGVRAHTATRAPMHLFVTDNDFVGTTRWPRSAGIEEVYAINVTGGGHMIAFNRIRDVGDGVHNGDHGPLWASDIHNNDIDGCTDDGIEADYADANVRVHRNRITNCFAAISAQPVRGGPVYVFRNRIYNVQYSPFKLHNHTAGVLLIHNTSVRAGIPFLIQPGTETVSDVLSRNNLFVGTRAPALMSTARMIRCDFDNDAYGWPEGPFARWNGTRFDSPLAARLAGAPYGTHGALILRTHATFADGLAPPDDFRARQMSAHNQPALAAQARAIDRGVAIANFNDDFVGSGPDMGCCEHGQPLPQVGPRQ